MVSPNKSYILRIPHIEKYDDMLRDQGYLDYVLYLRRNLVNAEIINLRERQDLNALNKIQRRSRVIISIMRTSQIKYGLAIAKYLKTYKKAVIIFGKLINYGAFSAPHISCSENRCIDYVIPSKCGEVAVLKYLQGDPSFLIRNLMDQRGLSRNVADVRIRDLRTSNEPHYNSFLTYELSRGCLNRCYYCSNSLSGFQRKDVAQAVAEIRKLIRINKTRKLVFVGPEINFDNNYLVEFLEKLVPLNIEWTSYAIPKGLNKRILLKMKRAGCRLLSLGLESADQRRLNSFGKKTRLNEVAKILQNCHFLGIKTQIHIIVGFPNETDEDIAKFKEFILLNRDYITNINISDFVIPKDSLIGNDPENWGIVVDSAEKGEFLSFCEPGRSLCEKKDEIEARITELNRFIDGVHISRFNISTPFDESFRRLYLDALNLGACN